MNFKNILQKPLVCISFLLAFFYQQISIAQVLTLEAYVADVINAHPQVNEQVHVYRQAFQDREIASSAWYPSMDIEASAGQYESDTPSGGPIDYDSDSVKLSLTQNLFNGFDTLNGLEQTDARVKAALYELIDTTDNVTLEAIQAYLDVLKQKQLYQLAEENVKSHEQTLKQIRRRSNSGAGRRSQLEQTEGRVARAYASKIAQKNNLDDSLTKLHFILGRYLSADDLVEPTVPPSPGIDVDLLIDRALVKHPAIQVALQNIEAAQADYRRAKRERYPTVDLQLANEISNDLNGVSGKTDNLSLTINLKYNLFRGGSDLAQERKKISNVHEQQQFAARIRRQVINTLRLAWEADRSLIAQLKYLKEHIDKSSQTMISYREEFFIGQRDLIDLLDAKTELNSAQNRYAEAYYQSYAARYRVHEGIGELFDSLGMEVNVVDDDVQVSMIKAQGTDDLPLDYDRDIDQEKSPSDHCDNSLGGSVVNDYGCMKTRVKTFVLEPVANDDALSVDQNSILQITPQTLLENDLVAEGQKLNIVAFTQPQNGKLALDASRNILYRPTEGFVGDDFFTYTIADDNGKESIGRVGLSVLASTGVSLEKVQYVNFKFNQTTLTESSQQKVDSIIKKIKTATEYTIIVYAYTDDVGSDSYNLNLSERRADAVKRLLVRNGISASNIEVYGLGEDKPIADNATAEGQAINRRGEFYFRAKKQAEDADSN